MHSQIAQSRNFKRKKPIVRFALEATARKSTPSDRAALAGHRRGDFGPVVVGHRALPVVVGAHGRGAAVRAQQDLHAVRKNTGVLIAWNLCPNISQTFSDSYEYYDLRHHWYSINI